MAFAWEHPHSAELPPKLREMLDHAQNFSRGHARRTVALQLDSCRTSPWQRGRCEVPSRLRESGRNRSQNAHVRWRNGNRERFWELVRAVNPRITGPTYEFINTWWDLALAGDAARLCDSSTARLLIRERERRLKKNLARIDNPRAQELWTGDSGTAQLEFRWFISQRLLGDIFDGLEAPDA